MRVDQGGSYPVVGFSDSEGSVTMSAHDARREHRYQLMNHSIGEHERDGWMAVAASVSMYITSLVFLAFCKAVSASPFAFLSMAAFVAGTTMIPIAWHSFQQADRMASAL